MREIDPRDCEHGWADTEQAEIDRLRAELAAAQAEVAQIRRIKNFWASQSPLSSHWNNARNQYFVDKVLKPIGEFLAGNIDDAACPAAKEE